MYYDNKIFLGKSGDEKIYLYPSKANRHGLIAGATGTGKTVTLKVLAESFSNCGVPVFLADIKGDLAGMCKPGEDNDNLRGRIEKFGLNECGFKYQSYPTEFWDIYEEKGLPSEGIPAGTKYEDLPDNFQCEVCRVGKENFFLQ